MFDFDGVKGNYRYTYRVYAESWGEGSAEEVDVVTMVLDDNAAFAQAKKQVAELYGDDEHIVISLMSVF